MPIEDPNMEKNQGKCSVVPGKCNQESKLKQSTEYNATPRNGRGCRGPYAGGPVARRPTPQRSKQWADKRHRERNAATTGAEHGHREQVAAPIDGRSVHNRSSKKGYQDASYLVNFRCETARDRHAERYSSDQWQLQRAAYHHERPHWPPQSRLFRPRHVKEQYLQARCQFVVRDDGHYAANLTDPDQLVEWASVEQVWLHEEAPTECPICLYPPVVARITRCGHTYCAACLLHYLALSDHASRRCPICEETVHPDQVRRCRLLARPPARLEDEVTFRLMRRHRSSLLGQPADQTEPWEEIITLADPEDKQRLAKLIMASPEQVASEILAPERVALERQLAELRGEPEACFVEQALTQLAGDELEAAERAAAGRHKPQRPDPDTTRQRATPLPTADADRAVVYESAFDERTVEAAAEEAPLSAAADLLTAAADDCPAAVGGGGAVRRRSVSETSTEVTAADLEVAAAVLARTTGRRHDHDQLLYYYQADGGEPVFLHALNCRMLLAEYGGWERCPSRVTARPVDVDAVTMTAGFRQRLRSLRHLPLTSQLQVVEVKLGPSVVSPQTLALFRDQVKKREQRRRDKQRRERQRERRLLQDERHHRYTSDTEPETAAAPAERPPTPPVVTSPEPDQSAAPSFAQLMRSAADGPRRAWPCAVRPAAAASAPAPAPAPADGRLDGDGAAAPSYSDSWSADLAAALERVDHERGADSPADVKPKGRKGKKGKTVLISGGLNF